MATAPFPADQPPGASPRPAVIMAAAVGLLALPSAVLAFSSRLDVAPSDIAANSGLASVSPAAVGARLARAVIAGVRGGSAFRFTPAGLAARPDRSVTVAVRVDAATAQAITVRALPQLPQAPVRLAAAAPVIRIDPMAYSLNIARPSLGLNPSPAPAFNLRAESHRLDAIPDLAGLPGDDARFAPPSRLSPHISLDEHDRPGRAPRTLEGVGEQSVDVGGSYRLSRNIDVTAGLRYSQDRDRLKPLTDNKTDQQAVFVGTQFRF